MILSPLASSGIFHVKGLQNNLLQGGTHHFVMGNNIKPLLQHIIGLFHSIHHLEGTALEIPSSGCFTVAVNAIITNVNSFLEAALLIQYRGQKLVGLVKIGIQVDGSANSVFCILVILIQKGNPSGNVLHLLVLAVVPKCLLDVVLSLLCFAHFLRHQGHRQQSISVGLLTFEGIDVASFCSSETARKNIKLGKAEPCLDIVGIACQNLIEQVLGLLHSV